MQMWIKNNYQKLGTFFLALSLVSMAIILFDYAKTNYFKIENISSLGTILAGISGIFGSFAGLFYVLENIKIQTETIEHQKTSIEQQRRSIELQSEELKNQIMEMKDSNQSFQLQTELMQRQSRENTFFNLLENHRKLIESLKINGKNGQEGLNELAEQIESDIVKYKFAAENKKIKKLENNVFPLHHIERNRDSIYLLYENIAHLIDYITLMNVENSFLNNTLHHNLSAAEKLIFPIYFINFTSEKSKKHIENCSLIEYYKNNKKLFFDKNQINHYPTIEAFIELNGMEFPEVFSKNIEIPKLKLQIKRNEERSIYIIESIKTTLRDNNHGNENEYPLNVQLNSDLFSLKLDDTFNKTILPYIYFKKTNGPESFTTYLELIIQLKIENNTFSYFKYYHIRVGPNNNSNFNINISEIMDKPL